MAKRNVVINLIGVHICLLIFCSWDLMFPIIRKWKCSVVISFGRKVVRNKVLQFWGSKPFYGWTTCNGRFLHLFWETFPLFIWRKFLTLSCEGREKKKITSSFDMIYAVCHALSSESSYSLHPMLDPCCACLFVLINMIFNKSQIDGIVAPS